MGLSSVVDDLYSFHLFVFDWHFCSCGLLFVSFNFHQCSPNAFVMLWPPRLLPAAVCPLFLCCVCCSLCDVYNVYSHVQNVLGTLTRFLFSGFHVSAFVGNAVALMSCAFFHTHRFKSPVVRSVGLKASPLCPGWGSPPSPQKDTVPSHSFLCVTPCSEGSFTLTTTHGADEDAEVWRNTALSILTIIKVVPLFTHLGFQFTAEVRI